MNVAQFHMHSNRAISVCFVSQRVITAHLVDMRDLLAESGSDLLVKDVCAYKELLSF